jgi:hypothetical protein
MESGRFKATIVLSSDHAGIAQQLRNLEREMYRVICRVDDPRKVRDYLAHVCLASMQWLEENPHSAPWDKQE